MAFDVLEVSLLMLEKLVPLEAKVRQKRKVACGRDGARWRERGPQHQRGEKRAGLDRADLFRRAAGSAGELTTCLRIARLRGHITTDDYTSVDVLLDRVRAMLWKLTH